MPQFFSNKKLIIVLTGIILLVSLASYSVKKRNGYSSPEQFVKDTVTVVEEWIQKPVDYVAGIVGTIKDLKNTYEENQMLKSRIEELYRLEVEVEELKKSNEDLNALLEKKNDLKNYKTIQATVVTRNPDQWNQIITIDRGAQDGVGKNDAVVTKEGLIGKIHSVAQFSSTVQLVSAGNPENRISAVVQGKDSIFGLIEGYDQQTSTLIFKNIPTETKIKKGQNVITSGLGGVFPRGLKIGTIESFEEDQYGLTVTAQLKPSANLYDVSDVLVIKREAPASPASKELNGGDE